MARGDFDTASAEMATMAILSLGIDIARWYGQDAPGRLAGSRGSRRCSTTDRGVQMRIVCLGTRSPKVCAIRPRPDGQYLGWADRVAAGPPGPVTLTRTSPFAANS